MHFALFNGGISRHIIDDKSRPFLRTRCPPQTQAAHAHKIAPASQRKTLAFRFTSRLRWFVAATGGTRKSQADRPNEEMKMNASVRWRVKGLYCEACNCESVCPCYSQKMPSQGFCEGPCIWHIQQGSHGEVKLDGLTVIMVQRCDGHMRDSKWKCWFYIDDRATDEQFEALQNVFTAKAGGYIGKIYASLWNVLTVERAKIDVKIEGWQQRYSILGMFDVAIGKHNLRLDAGPALCFIPNVAGIAALAEVDRFDNGQIKFDHANQNALTTTFAYRSD